MTLFTAAEFTHYRYIERVNAAREKNAVIFNDSSFGVINSEIKFMTCKYTIIHVG